MEEYGTGRAMHGLFHRASNRFRTRSSALLLDEKSVVLSTRSVLLNNGANYGVSCVVRNFVSADEIAFERFN